jgi:HKD family nuclease
MTVIITDQGHVRETYQYRHEMMADIILASQKITETMLVVGNRCQEIPGNH